MNTYRLIQGDCLKVLPALEDQSIDLVLTDPPYGINVAKNGTVGGGNLSKVINYGSVTWDSKPINKTIFKELQRVSKNQIIFGANYISNILPPSPCWCIWDKRRDTTPDNHADCELIYTSFSKPSRIFRHLWRGFLRDSERGKHYHPTQKPVKLMEWLIKNFSQENNLILDPFIGSGTTMFASQNLRRNCIGVELNKKYCNTIKQRCFNRTFLSHEVTYSFEKLE